MEAYFGCRGSFVEKASKQLRLDEFGEALLYGAIFYARKSFLS